MKRLARWLVGTLLVLVLLCGFMVLGTALWLRAQLTPQSLATTIGCWGPHDSVQKAARSRASQDDLVLYAVRGLPGPRTWRAPGRVMREVAIYHVFQTWWPTAERDRLFAEVAARLRSCPPWKPPG